jgi:hypothetical protein
MASSIYKWLAIPIFPVIFFFSNSSVQRENSSPLQGVRGFHPFHVSVVEINHNAADKTLEISCKLFTDDFEKVLTQNYPQDAAHKTKVDLINPPDKKAMDTLVKKYIKAHLSISVDGKPVNLSYVGFEHESEAIYGYVEVDNIPTVNKIDLTNKILHDLFTDQINLMHVIVGGNRKSTKLDYPDTQASFIF